MYYAIIVLINRYFYYNNNNYYYNFYKYKKILLKFYSKQKTDILSLIQVKINYNIPVGKKD